MVALSTLSKAHSRAVRGRDLYEIPSVAVRACCASRNYRAESGSQPMATARSAACRGGGYDKIPAAAWTSFDQLMANWKERRR
jgi:hypothetical protein